MLDVLDVDPWRTFRGGPLPPDESGFREFEKRVNRAETKRLLQERDVDGKHKSLCATLPHGSRPSPPSLPSRPSRPQEEFNSMTDEQKARLAALELHGWRLAAAPSYDEAHARSRITAPYMLERFFNGSPIREPGETLDHALDVAEWQQNRLAQLEERPTSIHSGAESIESIESIESND